MELLANLGPGVCGCRERERRQAGQTVGGEEMAGARFGGMSLVGRIVFRGLFLRCSMRRLCAVRADVAGNWERGSPAGIGRRTSCRRLSRLARTWRPHNNWAEVDGSPRIHRDTPVISGRLHTHQVDAPSRKQHGPFVPSPFIRLSAVSISRRLIRGWPYLGGTADSIACTAPSRGSFVELAKRRHGTLTASLTHGPITVCRRANTTVMDALGAVCARAALVTRGELVRPAEKPVRREAPGPRACTASLVSRTVMEVFAALQPQGIASRSRQSRACVPSVRLKPCPQLGGRAAPLAGGLRCFCRVRVRKCARKLRPVDGLSLWRPHKHRESKLLLDLNPCKGKDGNCCLALRHLPSATAMAKVSTTVLRMPVWTRPPDLNPRCNVASHAIGGRFFMPPFRLI